MKKNAIIFSLVILLLTLGINLIYAQGPADGVASSEESQGVEGTLPSPAQAEPDAAPSQPGTASDNLGNEPSTTPRDALSITAQVNNSFSYQGILKESGVPVTGSRKMTFRFHTNATCSAQTGADNTQILSVTNGLFQAAIPLDQNVVNGQGLWLQTLIDSTSIDCQEILVTPYASSLSPGAIISGSLSFADSYGGAALKLFNDDGRGLYVQTSSFNNALIGLSADGSTADTHPGGSFYQAAGEFAGRIGVIGASPTTTPNGIGVFGIAQGSGVAAGVYGRSTSTTGANYGVYGTNNSADGFAGYFYNSGGVAIQAGGSGIIKSTANTEISVSPQNSVECCGLSGVTIAPYQGSVVLTALSSGTKSIYVPIDLPTTVFGVEQKLKSFRVCYDLDTAVSYIDNVSIEVANDAGGSSAILSDATDRKGTSWSCYTISDPTPDAITGSVLIRFVLIYGGTGSSHEIRIGKITLTLTEN